MFKVYPFAVKLVVASDAPEDVVKQAALDCDIVRAAQDGSTTRKVIVIRNLARPSISRLIRVQGVVFVSACLARRVSGCRDEVGFPGEDAEREVAVRYDVSRSGDQFDDLPRAEASGDAGGDAKDRNAAAVACGEVREGATDTGGFAGERGEDVTVAVLGTVSESVAVRRSSAAIGRCPIIVRPQPWPHFFSYDL